MMPSTLAGSSGDEVIVVDVWGLCVYSFVLLLVLNFPDKNFYDFY